MFTEGPLPDSHRRPGDIDRILSPQESTVLLERFDAGKKKKKRARPTCGGAQSKLGKRFSGARFVVIARAGDFLS